jgi:hypothetical protein
MTPHTKLVHPDCLCESCIGELFTCTVCNCATGTLPSECPGVIVNGKDQDQIWANKLDFVNGEWVKK